MNNNNRQMAVQQPEDDAAGQMVAAGMSVQRTTTSYAQALAVQKPRKLANVKHAVEEEAMLAGESFYYGWGAGKDRIEGPSIKLANALVRLWGNCAIELLPIQDLADSWVFTAVFVDLETGFTLPRQFRQSKRWQVFGKHDEARKDDIRFQIGQSKAIRNVVLNAMPAGLVDLAMDAAKSGVRAKIEEYIKKNSIAAAQDLMLKELAKLGVPEERVLVRLGIADRKAIGVEELVTLSGDKRAIRDGEARPEELFPEAGAGAGGTENLHDRLKAAKDKKGGKDKDKDKKAEEPPAEDKKAGEEPKGDAAE